MPTTEQQLSGKVADEDELLSLPPQMPMRRRSAYTSEVIMSKTLCGGWAPCHEEVSGHQVVKTSHGKSLVKKKVIMNAEQIAVVQSTFEKVHPRSDATAEMFYTRLFELDPSVKSLFKGDMKEQGRKLMHMIGLAVRGLHRLETLVPAIQGLGTRHVGYGVKNEHYDTVGAALLWTLEQGLGRDFTPEVKEAWAEAYHLLTSVMQEADVVAH